MSGDSETGILEPEGTRFPINHRSLEEILESLKSVEGDVIKTLELVQVTESALSSFFEVDMPSLTHDFVVT